MSATTPRMPKNYEIAPGLGRFSKGTLYHKKGLYVKLKKPFEKKKTTSTAPETHVKKPIGGDKNGTHRLVPIKAQQKFKAAPGTPAKRIHRKVKIQKLRPTIIPGTVLIILVGRHRGKRVVFLKQLPKSGLLLVTGPLKINSTPLRRVAQAFVIATKTKLDLSKVNIPETISDDYFKKVQGESDKSKSGIFATGEKKEYTVSDQRKEDQKTIDAGILEAIRAHPDKKYLFGYLGSRFSLAKGDKPHKMEF